MKLLGLAPMLWTKHLNLSVGFYTNILKFNCDEMNVFLRYVNYVHFSHFINNVYEIRGLCLFVFW